MEPAYKHENQDVEIVKEVAEGDKDFDANVAKVVIRLADGTEKTVARSEVTPAA